MPLVKRRHDTCSALTSHVCLLLPAQAACFREVWRAQSAALLSALRAADWGAADGLRGVSWRVSVPIASDADAAPAAPVAVLELALGRAGDGDAGTPGGAVLRRVAFECTHTQLGQLFDDMERIQAQLDALT